MSVLRARRPMLVAVLLGLSLTAVGCGLGGSGHTAGGLKTDPSLAVDPGAGESPDAVTTEAVTANAAARPAMNRRFMTSPKSGGAGSVRKHSPIRLDSSWAPERPRQWRPQMRHTPT